MVERWWNIITPLIKDPLFNFWWNQWATLFVWRVNFAPLRYPSACFQMSLRQGSEMIWKICLTRNGVWKKCRYSPKNGGEWKIVIYPIEPVRTSPTKQTKDDEWTFGGCADRLWWANKRAFEMTHFFHKRKCKVANESNELGDGWAPPTRTQRKWP